MVEAVAGVGEGGDPGQVGLVSLDREPEAAGEDDLGEVRREVDRPGLELPVHHFKLSQLVVAAQQEANDLVRIGLYERPVLDQVPEAQRQRRDLEDEGAVRPTEGQQLGDVLRTPALRHLEAAEGIFDVVHYCLVTKAALPRPYVDAFVVHSP